MGVALLDVNVLVALFHPDHIHHEAAHDWFADERRHGWATCPITESGFLRIVLQLAAGDARVRAEQVAKDLRAFRRSGKHVFWPDSVSLEDATLFNAAHIGGHRQVTDVYLLGLATRMAGRLATFDRTIPLKAVAGATAASLAVIEG
jgi:toxin-antitoxin system PIN domain toxin